METILTPNPEKSEVTLTVTVSGDELSPFVRKAASRLTKDKALKGFRPGKAPVEVVEEAFGTDRLMHEVVDRAVPHFFVQAITEENVDAIARPAVNVEKLDRKEGLEFTATVAVLPEVTIGDLSAITVERKKSAVREEDVEKELTTLAKMRSTYLDVPKAAEKGDTARVDFTIYNNGTVIEGGEGKDHPVHIGEGHFVKDFEEGLIGMSAEGEKEFDMTFPGDYGKKDYAGKTMQAKVKVNAVQKQIVPELNDEFAKTLGGEITGIDDLRNKLTENMQQERDDKERQRWQGELNEKLAEATTFGHIPEALIEKEIDRNVEELNQMLAMQQKTFDDYVAERGKDAAAVREEMRPNAEKRVKIGLALRAFAEQEDIKVDESEVEAKVTEYLQRFGSPEEAEKAVNPEELREQLAYMLQNQASLEALEKKVKIKNVESEKEEVQAETTDS